MADPKAYGMPTFDEFCKSPDSFRLRPDHVLASVDNGAENLKHLIKTQKYEIDGVKCRTLEEVERVARNEGIDLGKLKMKPELEKTTAGKLEVIVRFVSKDLYVAGR